MRIEDCIIAAEDVLHSLCAASDQYVAFVGAGASKEAGVPLANEIAWDIRQQLLRHRADADADAWARKNLHWDDLGERYAKSVEAYGSAEERVAYFRGILAGKAPSFAHYAIAALMAANRLHGTAMTTNFDKLLERAFAEENSRECQAIRTDTEAEYWGREADKCYLLKLHGDYDTHNILNTRRETRRISKVYLEAAEDVLLARGLVAFGAGGNEASIITFLEDLLRSEEEGVLSRGVKWGVFVPGERPNSVTDDQSVSAVLGAIEQGAISEKLVKLFVDMNEQYGDKRPCSFFPVWGTGNFLYRMIESLGDPELLFRARLFLDHEQRLGTLLREGGIDEPAIDRHLTRLRETSARLRSQASPPFVVPNWTVAQGGRRGRKFDIVYGDITTDAVLKSATPNTGVVSPEDTLLTAGGGVALRLAQRAGLRPMLNELAKFAPIDHGRAAVTSAGALPVRYVFHSATLQIMTDGEYAVTDQVVEATMSDVLAKARSLGLDRVVTPLLGAGVAGLSEAESLGAILRAFLAASPRHCVSALTIVVYDEGVMGVDEIRAEANVHAAGR